MVKFGVMKWGKSAFFWLEKSGNFIFDNLLETFAFLYCWLGGRKVIRPGQARNSAVADKPRDAFMQYAIAWLTSKSRQSSVLCHDGEIDRSSSMGVGRTKKPKVSVADPHRNAPLCQIWSH